MVQDSPRLVWGKILCDEIKKDGTTSGWSNDDYKCFIDFYKAIDFPSFCRIQKKYAPKTAHNTFFLILYEMGLEDRDVRRIMGITQEAIRSTRYRIMQKVIIRRYELLHRLYFFDFDIVFIRSL